MSLRERILSVDDRPLIPFNVPEWGVSFFIRPLSVDGRVRWIEAYRNNEMSRAAVMLLILACCHEDGTPVFTEDDAKALATKSPAIVDRIAKKVMEISMLRGEADANHERMQP